jgi:hypothetical protein
MAVKAQLMGAPRPVYQRAVSDAALAGLALAFLPSKAFLHLCPIPRICLCRPPPIADRPVAFETKPEDSPPESALTGEETDVMPAII